jgi:hypothetical protein
MGVSESKEWEESTSSAKLRITASSRGLKPHESTPLQTLCRVCSSHLSWMKLQEGRQESLQGHSQREVKRARLG